MPAHGYEECKPWSACFAAAVTENDFWQRELATPALLFLTRNKRDQGPRASEQSQPGEQPRTKRTRASRRFQGDDKSKTGTDGLYTHNRKGIEVCRLFNQGRFSVPAFRGFVCYLGLWLLKLLSACFGTADSFVCCSC